MILQPAETTSCRFLKFDTTVQKLQQYQLSSSNYQLEPLNNAFGLPCFRLVAGTQCDAKPFNVPLKIAFSSGEAYVVDCRQVTSVSNMGQYRVNQPSDFETLTLMCLLTAIWDSPDRGLLENIALDLSPVFGKWLETTLGSNNLMPDQRTDILVVSAYYYLRQIRNDPAPKLVDRLSKDLHLEFERVKEIVEMIDDKYGEMKTLIDLVEAFKLTSAGIRLQKYDESVFYQVTCGAWTGPLGRGFLEVASEYPPYIVALVHQAVTEKSYRRSRFADCVKLFDRRQEISNIGQSLAYLRKEK